jgi:DNA-binding NarL/FixJ family response regulator
MTTKNNSQFSILNSQLKLNSMTTKNNSQFLILNSQLIRVAIVDDHHIVIEGFEKIIEESGIACFVGKACYAAECWEMLKTEQPDVLMLDVGLPDGNGMDLCPRIKAKYPAVNILILTNYAEYTVISNVLNNGASGYILKNATHEEIVEGIRLAASGKRFLSEDANQLLKKGNHGGIELTRREGELLRLLMRGYTSVEIADKMCLSYETVRGYRKTLHLKFDVHNSAELMQKANEFRFI